MEYDEENEIRSNEIEEFDMGDIIDNEDNNDNNNVDVTNDETQYYEFGFEVGMELKALKTFVDDSHSSQTIEDNKIYEIFEKIGEEEFKLHHEDANDTKIYKVKRNNMETNFAKVEKSTYVYKKGTVVKSSEKEFKDKSYWTYMTMGLFAKQIEPNTNYVIDGSNGKFYYVHQQEYINVKNTVSKKEMMTMFEVEAQRPPLIDGTQSDYGMTFNYTHNYNNDDTQYDGHEAQRFPLIIDEETQNNNYHKIPFYEKSKRIKNPKTKEQNKINSKKKKS
jgi:hypothetical protein